MKFVSDLLKIALLSTGLIAGATSAVEIKFTDSDGQPVDSVVVSWSAQNLVKPSAEPVIIDQVDRAFVPHISLITAGQRVDFPNSDNIRHHVYSFSESNPFEIKLYRNRPVEPILFANAGIVALGCNIHDQMIGYIYVAGKDETALMSNDKGIVNIPNVKSFQYWHPRMSLTGTQVNDAQVSDPQTMTLTLDLMPSPEQNKSTTFGSGSFGNN